MYPWVRWVTWVPWAHPRSPMGILWVGSHEAPHGFPGFPLELQWDPQGPLGCSKNTPGIHGVFRVHPRDPRGPWQPLAKVCWGFSSFILQNGLEGFLTGKIVITWHLGRSIIVGETVGISSMILICYYYSAPNISHNLFENTLKKDLFRKKREGAIWILLNCSLCPLLRNCMTVSHVFPKRGLKWNHGHWRQFISRP